MTAADLDVLEDDVPQAVDTFQEAVDPYQWCSLDSRWEHENADLVKYGDRLRPRRPSEDNLALITFCRRTRLNTCCRRIASGHSMRSATTPPMAAPALYDALYNSLMHLKTAKGRRAVVVLSDGRDENNPGRLPAANMLSKTC